MRSVVSTGGRAPLRATPAAPIHSRFGLDESPVQCSRKYRMRSSLRLDFPAGVLLYEVTRLSSQIQKYRLHEMGLSSIVLPPSQFELLESIGRYVRILLDKLGGTLQETRRTENSRSRLYTASTRDPPRLQFAVGDDDNLPEAFAFLDDFVSTLDFTHRQCLADTGFERSLPDQFEHVVNFARRTHRRAVNL